MSILCYNFPAARVVVNLKISSLTETVAFLSSSYNFSLPENQEAGVLVGEVTASSGSNLYNVTYSLNTHKDLFSINLSGGIFTKAQLDKEQQEWYFLDVEVVDTRNPPTSAMTTVLTLTKMSYFTDCRGTEEGNRIR